MKTCPICGESFTPRTANQLYCTGRQGSCYRAAENQRYRSQNEDADCAHCGTTFTRTRGVSQRVYCSDDCHHAAKRDRLLDPRAPRSSCRGPVNLHPMPAPDPVGSDVDGYVAAMLRDPCSYCGGRSECLDHVVPSYCGGTDDWTNFAPSCRRCNSRKTTTPLLLFLGWDRAQQEFEPWRAAVGAVHRELRARRLAAA